MNKTLFKAYWDLIGEPIQARKGWFALLAILLLGGIGLQVANPQIVRTFIDTATSGEDSTKLTHMAVAFIGMALLQRIVAVSASYVGENLAWQTNNDLRAQCKAGRSSQRMATPGELAASAAMNRSPTATSVSPEYTSGTRSRIQGTTPSS